MRGRVDIEPPLEPDEYRYWAEKQWEAFSADRANILTYINDQSRWMIASLLLINAGALAAVAQSMGATQVAETSAWWFLIGVICSITCGLVTWGHAQWIALRVMSPMANPLWIVRPGYLKPISREAMRWVYGALMLAVLAGFASLACFVLGVTELQAERAPIASANDKRCLAIQRDMLSARPRHADNPAIFGALGCRPQSTAGGSMLRPRQ
jgi:hypothetical protein